MNASEAQTKLKRIELLTIKEIDMIYSLARVGEWTDLEIGRRYGISNADVRRVIDHYEELRGTVQKNQHHERLPQESSQELTTKERKRRSDARFATTADRQAAYRARLKEKRHADLQQLPASSDTNSRSPADPELIDNALTPPVAETDSQCAETEPLN